ncbi:Pectinesterase inhibitor [Corchorus capsularis]|uniref:Pectinesterase inhibitor n=1 Tax=Corchorus capsularis TaxID=210143 RepID=A0A1R3H170_COCAP|nr:Pectinesterase inhibitor [Corchorus capsularis]
MEINKITLVLISLSCLFSFSASRLSNSLSPAPAPAPSSLVVKSHSDEVANENTITFSIMPSNADPGLQKICGDTDHPIECVTTTAPFLQENMLIEPVSILKIAVEAMGNKTKEALATANRLLLDPAVDETMVSCLETCIESYNAVLDVNRKVVDAITVHDLYVMNMELSANVENVHTCSDAFEEADIESPIKEFDSLLEKMISNSLAIGVDLVRF